MKILSETQVGVPIGQKPKVLEGECVVVAEKLGARRDSVTHPTSLDYVYEVHKAGSLSSFREERHHNNTAPIFALAGGACKDD
tara:strand:+ start:252 stop:500 length:249 start_codon:yes stop_codon:yes gene_type:complete